MPLLSLWELMQKFSPDKFVSLTRGAMNLAQLIQIYKERTEQIYTLKQYREQMQELLALCGEAKLPMTIKTIGRVLELVELQHGGARVDGPTLERASQQVALMLEDEMSVRLCFWLGASEAELWDAKRLSGEDVSDRFPSTDYELEEYAKCCAIGRHTAAVFHLMRVLEIGLSVLAVSIGADPANKSWEQILIGIQTKIDENVKLKGPSWKDTEQYYSEISAQFRNLKNAWRNYTMHVHVTYDKERTEEVFVHIRAIMKVLATRIRESP